MAASTVTPAGEPAPGITVPPSVPAALPPPCGGRRPGRPRTFSPSISSSISPIASPAPLRPYRHRRQGRLRHHDYGHESRPRHSVLGLLAPSEQLRRCHATPCRRATLQTGSITLKVSATIRTSSSSDHRRCCSAPVITSNRRTGFAKLIILARSWLQQCHSVGQPRLADQPSGGRVRSRHRLLPVGSLRALRLILRRGALALCSEAMRDPQTQADRDRGRDRAAVLRGLPESTAGRCEKRERES